MTEGLNKVMLLGNLGADPELRVTGGGQAVLKFRMATTESYVDSNNARQERTEWHSVTMWGKRGEALAKFLKKGERVFVEGRIQTTSYEKDGEKRYRTEVVATNLILNGRGEEKQRDDRSDAGPPQRRGTRAASPHPDDDFGGYQGGDDEPPF
jgi:single-strand DNA-binding protein